MRVSAQARSWPRLLAAGASLVLAGLPLVGCAEAEEGPASSYEPAKLEPVPGAEIKRVIFTPEGAKRTGLQTATVRRTGGRLAVPYEALIYDGAGGSWVYKRLAPLSFLRAKVEVDRIEGDRVLLNDGPPVGSDVVTVGASEVYGAELEIAGAH